VAPSCIRYKTDAAQRPPDGLERFIALRSTFMVTSVQRSPQEYIVSLGDAESGMILESLGIEPHLEVFERAAEIIVQASVPGVAIEHVYVEIANDILTIIAHTRALETPWRSAHEQWRPVCIHRKFKLDARLDQSRLKVTLRDGGLLIELPKVTHAQLRQSITNS
jgi:HSP20 family molecular chaperone IbpA